jgi:hypothetical protein
MIQRATRPGQERPRRRRNEERAAESGGERGDKQRWARVEEFLGLESHAAAHTGTAPLTKQSEIKDSAHISVGVSYFLFLFR